MDSAKIPSSTCNLVSVGNFTCGALGEGIATKNSIFLEAPAQGSILVSEVFGSKALWCSGLPGSQTSISHSHKKARKIRQRVPCSVDFGVQAQTP